MAALFALAIPAFSRMGLLPGHEQKDLEKLSFGSSAWTVFGLDCLVAAGASFYYSTRIESGAVGFRILAGALLLLGAGLLIAGTVLRKRKTDTA